MTREDMIDALVDHTINIIEQDIYESDYSLLEALIRGDSGWTQYCHLTDEQIEAEYKELGNTE